MFQAFGFSRLYLNNLGTCSFAQIHSRFHLFFHLFFACGRRGKKVGGAVASWLVRSSPERVIWVRALAGDIVLCSWARHLTLTVPLSTEVYKWVRVNCWGKFNKLRGNDLRWTSILSRGSRNTRSRFMLQKPGISSGSYGPLGIRKASFLSSPNFTFSRPANSIFAIFRDFEFPRVF